MNSTFKVVFNKARGALMVVNEVTSSVQAKGTKTVVATAVAAMIAGVAGAAAAETGAPSAPQKVTITVDAPSKLANGTVFDGYTTAEGGKAGALAVYAQVLQEPVTGLVFKNNASKDQGGAIRLDAKNGNTSLMLVNAKFENNTAESWGGAIRMYGDAASTNEARLSLRYTDNATIKGNVANKSGKYNYVDMGGFAHLGGFSTLDLRVDEGKTLTIGVADATDKTVDSIASTGAGNTLNINGNVVVNSSMEAYTGDIVVTKDSSLTMATGYGSIDLFSQDQANKNSETYKGYGSLSNGNLTVEQDATANIGAMTVTRSTAVKGETASTAGTKLTVAKDGTLVVDSITVTTKDYTAPLTTDKTKTFTNTTVGWGSLTNAGDATITKGLVLENGTQEHYTKFDIAGNVTVGYIDIAGDVMKEDGETVAKKGGKLTITSGETTVLGASKNAGAITGAGALITKADFANSGEVDLGGLTVLGGTFANTDKFTVKNVAVKGGTLTNAAEKTATIDDLAIDGGKVANDGVMVAKTISIVNGSLTNAGKLYGQAPAAAASVAAPAPTPIPGIDSITIGDKGVLTTGAAIHGGENFIVFKQLDLEKGGTLNITALNDNATGDKTKAFDLLGFVEGEVNLNGGDLQVAGKTYTGAVKVAGTGVEVNFNGGSYTVSDLTVASGGTVAVGKNGNLSVTGKVENAVGTTLSNAGKLTVTASGIDLKLKDGAVESVTGSKFNKISNTGTVVVTGLDGQSVKFDKVAAVKQAVVGTTRTGFVDLGKIAVELDDNVQFDEKTNTIEATDANKLTGVSIDKFKNTTVKEVVSIAGGSFGALQAKTTAGGVTVNGNTILNNDGLVAHDKDRKAVNITINASQTLTTTGANAQIGDVTGGTGTLEVGAGKLTSAANATTTTYYGIDVDKLNVAEGAALESKGTVKIKTAGNIAGSATIGTLNLVSATNLGITGNAVVDTLAGVDPSTGVAGSTINVGNANATGSMTVVKQTGGTVIVDPAFDTGLPAATYAVSELTGGQVVAAENSYVAVGSDIAAAKSAFAKTGYTLAASGANTVRAVAYVAGNKDARGNFVAIGGDVMAEGQNGTATGTGTSAGAMMIVDVATVDKSATPTAVFSGNFTNDGILYLANVAVGDTFKIATDIAATPATLPPSVPSYGVIKTAAGRLIGATEPTSGVLTVGFKDGTADDAIEAWEGLDTIRTTVAAFENGAVNGGSSSQRFATWLFDENNGLVVAGGVNEVEEVGNAVAYIGATAGLANVTMDAVSEFNDSVAARTSILAQRGEGVNVWVDVNGGKFEGKKVVEGEVGYSSDLYGAVLGADVTVACGATVGAALTVGTADTDSKGDSVKTSVDTDFVGIGLYANKPIGEVANVAFDLGYIQASNELSVKEYGIGKTDADTDAVTFGVRGELLAKVGAIDVVPHVGLRWTRLSFDQFEAGYVTDIDSMNVFQMPVGVTFKGDVEVEGWNIAPAFDLTFTPTWGDKDMEQKVWVAGSSVKDTLEGTRVLDNNVVNATLGVAAQNGAWTFGLDYKLGVGSDDRMNNSFNARVNYAF